MKDVTLRDLFDMQAKLYEKNKERWQDMDVTHAKDHLLYMIEELGEAIAILKKQKEKAIMHDAVTREAFVTEMSDVLMYYVEALRRFQVTPEELGTAYIQKFQKNMSRNYDDEYRKQHDLWEDQRHSK